MADSYLLMPENWIKATLEPNIKEGLIIEVSSGATPKTAIDEYWDGDIPWLTPKEITGSEGIYVGFTERNITQLGLKNSSTKLFRSGTVMLSKRAPVGAVAVNTRDMCTNQGFLNFSCGEKLKPLYFAYWLKINKPYLDAIANGSTYPELYKSDLFEFQIAVPSIKEQDKILNIIGALQFASLSGNAMEQSVTDIEKIKDIRSASNKLKVAIDDLMYLIFSGEITVDELSVGNK